MDETAGQSQALHHAGKRAVQDLFQTEGPVHGQRHRIQGSEFPIPAHHLLAHPPDAQQDLDPGDQLIRVERLRDVIVGPDLQTEDHVAARVFRGEHDHREMPPALVRL